MNINDGFIPNESFKHPSEIRQQFPPHLYHNMYQPQLLMPNNSAFHRPEGGNIKSGIPVSFIQHLALDDEAIKAHYHSQLSGFVPHLSNLELIRQAGIFYPRITDLTGRF